ncbi:sugar transferase [Sulfitobacter albidus]|uniref:Sugar transferase n=1 Tax=Sulfitobacter albidus TaxID=2829501 RepID=A0A975PL19_9RHOB|nr:sugar transferase [Sulfitobacter albidus]QUJ75214.1 sugar transferase [Sulfitobacter albidus]
MKKFDTEQPGYGLARLAAASGDLNAHLTLARAVQLHPAACAETREGLYRSVGKRLLETLLVILSLPFFLPVVAVCALALWIEGGNPFYRQTRLGENGRRFSILKLRTMTRDADQVLESYLAANPEMRAEWDDKQKLRHDPRVTRIGALLRATSLDELPQLWNVLTGDMSLIGPRPMMPEQLPMYGNPSHYFALRPGITGLWQVSARNENGFAFRNEVDRTYNTTLSFWGDIALIFRTVHVMLRRTGC